jgi:hypothetical protein
MNKRSRYNKNNKNNNKSKKYYGGATGQTINKSMSHVGIKPPGIFDVIGNRLSSYSGDVVEYVSDKGLRLLGLEKIKNDDDEEKIETTKIDDKIEKISDVASNTVSGLSSIGKDIVNVFDKGSSALVGQINDVLESPKVYQGLTQATTQTAKDAANLLNKFNDVANTPELKAATEEALDSVADYTNIAVKAMDEPINNAIDILNNAGAEAAAGVASGVIKVATDAAGAVPGVGAVIDLGKALNDGSAAVGKVVEASSKSVEALSDAVEQTSENFKEGIEKLKEVENKVIENKPDIVGNGSTALAEGLNNFKNLNKEGTNTLNRVNSSIDKFVDPVKNNSIKTTSGGKKTKRKLFKRKSKSKRVRFVF